MLVILSGCSGSGKNTIIKELLKRNINYKQFKSCTTRAPRDNEKGQEPYYYLTKDEFFAKEKKGEFLETEEVHGNYYGILKASVDEIVNGKEIFVKDVGVYGVENLYKLIGNKVKILSIFLDVPKKELMSRLNYRGEKIEEISKRMERYKLENSKKKNFDIVIKNKNLMETVEKIENLAKCN